MSNKAFYSFVAGAAVGAFCTWQYAKKYFNGIVEDTKKKYEAADAEEQPRIDKDKKQEETEETTEDDGEAERVNTSKKQYHKAVKETTESEDTEKKAPYIITQNEFADGAMDVYVSYSYFEDGVVTDEYGNIVDDVEEALGVEFMDNFDEDDMVYVRNEERRCDYEIEREGMDYYEKP